MFKNMRAFTADVRHFDTESVTFLPLYRAMHYSAKRGLILLCR